MLDDEDDDDLDLVWVSVLERRYCDCCKHKHMKRVFHIKSTFMDDFDLGYVCAGHWFGINLTGNIHKARTKLQNKLNSMDSSDIEDIVANIIAEAAE